MSVRQGNGGEMKSNTSNPSLSTIMVSSQFPWCSLNVNGALQRPGPALCSPLRPLLILVLIAVSHFWGPGRGQEQSSKTWHLLEKSADCSNGREVASPSDRMSNDWLLLHCSPDTLVGEVADSKRAFIHSVFVFFLLLRGKEGQINLGNEKHNTCPQSQYSEVWGRRIKGLRPASATNSSEPSQPGIHSKTLLAQEPHRPLSSELHWAAKWGSEQCGLKTQCGKHHSFLCLLRASCRFFSKHSFS